MVTIIRKETPKCRLRAVVKRAKSAPQKGFDAKKHLGKWKLAEDALATQQRLRDERGLKAHVPDAVHFRTRTVVG
ncbi:MAG: hypothetical protein JSS84_02520 [Bacteroidetes bacterium]|nr:hypothetical protein [Bacteroidota bacterium]